MTANRLPSTRVVVAAAVLGAIVLAITVVGWAAAFFALKRYRARVPYWV